MREPITVRRPKLDLPEDLDPVYIEGEPEESYANVALSLLLPYVEPYLIRTMRSARPRVRNPALADDLDKFAAQEGQHYRQHARFNAVLRRRGLGALTALEDELDADYRRFSSARSLRFNLAYAEGFEALTAALAVVAAELDMSRWHPAMRELVMWHLMEELEHRTVAFDVHHHVCGGWLYRLVVGWYAQWHLVRFVIRAGEVMLAADPRTEGEFGGRAGRRRREPRIRRIILRQLLPRVLRTYSPWYTPHDIPMPESMKAVAERYARGAP